MIKARKIATLLVFLFIGTSTSLIAQVNPQMDREETSAADVSDKELNMFADAYQSVQMANQQAQQKMMKMIQDKGLDVQRFQEIQQASANPNQESDATAEEMKKHQELVAQFQKMQPELQQDMEKAVVDSGLSMERYQSVAAAVQNSQALQQKLQKIMMERNTQG
ncbi:DUF4168 domain-containing protein [Mesonia maritima]|uniref:DUF4168 domain-containing protein n=1 Tax=Mesonia maritima TaxID=1793873 RepID=A0ABU1K5J1_9FLAO|nr:DUF4168 domain-containing protein [Mesonia maritima]MDR6300877.1 hypothetical protein [Mesonia maritima]